MKYLKLFEELKRDNDSRSERKIELDWANTYTNEEAAEKIYEILQRDCKPFLDELKSQKSPKYGDSFLLRLAHRKGHNIDLKTTRKDRRPRDTAFRTHNLLNDIFIETHNVKARQEGVFVTTDPEFELDYNANLFFPIGEYKYFYHEEVRDLYPFMMASGVGEIKEETVDFIESRRIDITIEELKSCNSILKLIPNMDKINKFGQIYDILKEKGFLEGIEVDEFGRYNISTIKEDVISYAENTLRKFLVPLIKEYKSEGILDTPKKVEATFICDNYYLINDIPFTRLLSDLIFD